MRKRRRKRSETALTQDSSGWLEWAGRWSEQRNYEQEGNHSRKDKRTGARSGSIGEECQVKKKANNNNNNNNKENKSNSIHDHNSFISLLPVIGLLLCNIIVINYITTTTNFVACDISSDGASESPSVVVASRWLSHVFLPCKFHHLDEEQTVSSSESNELSE